MGYALLWAGDRCMARWCRNKSAHVMTLGDDAVHLCDFHHNAVAAVVTGYPLDGLDYLDWERDRYYWPNDGQHACDASTVGIDSRYRYCQGCGRVERAAA